MSEIADMSVRLPDGSLAKSATKVFPYDHADDVGGGGLYSSADDYVKLLVDLLGEGEDRKLLKREESVTELFTQQLSEESRVALHAKLYADYEGNRQGEIGRMFSGSLPNGTPIGHGLGELVVLEDVDERRRKGSRTWSGFPNLRWLIDPCKGIALFYGSQLLPDGDSISAELFKRFCMLGI